MSLEIMNALKLVAPILQDLFQEDIQVVITDRTKFTDVIENEKIKTTFKPGDIVYDNVPLGIAMRENKISVGIVPKEIYGFPLKATAYPICDENSIVIGSVGIGWSFENPVKIEEASVSLSSYMEETTASIQEIAEASKKLSAAIRKISATVSFNGLVGIAPVFKRALDLALRAAATDATVIIQGETGVGKEGLARTIHQAGLRAQGPFVAVNCGAIPQELIASELFGYSPGAFTGASPRGNRGKFEAANGGTFFLDEVAELPLEMQTYLLRVLQEKEVVRLGTNDVVPIDVRVVAATHRDLRQLVRQGRFREDLYYRLSVLEIEVPPLRERPEDFPHLIDHFLSQNGVQGVRLRNETLHVISLYDWPGNVRELMNVIQRAVILNEDVETVLLKYVRSQTGANDRPEKSVIMQTDQITRALVETGGNVTQAARELGVARSTIYRHLKDKNIPLKRSFLQASAVRDA